MSRSTHGGRHELGQNFLIHSPTIERVARLAARCPGPVLELGAGDGALTEALARIGCDVTAIDIDEHRVRRLQSRVPGVRVERADVLRYPLVSPTIVGNVPFHLTTPILRRLLRERSWQHAVLLLQWEVARKRAGIGGATMMTAQAAPWFTFALELRVPARHFAPMPSVDGGVLTIARRSVPLVPVAERATYENFVHAVFTGRGGTLTRIVRSVTRVDPAAVGRVLAIAGVDRRSRPRDLDAEQWATLFSQTRGRT